MRIKSIARALVALATGLLLSLHAGAVTCASQGAYATGTMPCCAAASLYKDANNRCQKIGCKKLDEPGNLINGVSDCCVGLVPIGGPGALTCRVPVLSPACGILGGPPRSGMCCPGLTKGANGLCQRNSAVYCTANDIGSPDQCCVLKTCSHCYCPSPYFRN